MCQDTNEKEKLEGKACLFTQWPEEPGLVLHREPSWIDEGTAIH